MRAPSFSRLFAGFVLFSIGVTAAAAQTVPVRIGYIPVLGTAQIFVADKEGWLKDADFDPKFIVFDSGPTMIQAMASGKLEIYVGGVAPLAVIRSKGFDIKVVASTAIEEMTFVAGPKLAKFFTPELPAADAFKAFRMTTGKPAKLATQPPGSVPHTTLNHWLFEVIKAAPDDVEIVTMGIDATQQAVMAGAIDGATLREPADSIVTMRDPRVKIMAYGADMFPDQPGTVIAVQADFLKAHRENIEKLVATVIRANDLIAKDPRRAAVPIESILGKGLVDTPTILAALRSKATKFAADPRAIMTSTRAMQAYQVKIGTLDKEYPLDGLFDASFYEKAAGLR